MRSDQLSEVFELVEVRGQMTGAFEVYGPWRSQHEIGDPLKLIAMVHGHGRLLADGLDTPIELGPGEVAILNGRSWLRIEGGTGDGPVCEFLPGPGYNSYGHDDADGPPDVVVGGHIEVNHVGRTLLAQALPPVGHVRAAEASALHRNLRLLAEEAGAGRVGSAFAIRQYAQLLVLELLRAYVDQADLPPGWLRVMTDERLSPALTLMHGEPGRPWSLEELARAAAMSRTSFAERFRTLAGVPPLTYLGRWRMLLARRALRDGDVRVGSLAAELGYGSESAFSTAFKREVGMSPLRYRSRARQAGEPHPAAAPA
ncbi:AraC family transcriptional regulator [Nonomuraea salmonea]|jgi:AraC-like DNA-binding protein|uniref:AraC family transcriptional regulator n=1 Tax=Nonomuraea salmonea TaxID=46181 RepID=A0ABV5P3I7_9ACTN